METKTSQPPARPAAQPKEIDRDELLERIAKLNNLDLELIKALVDSRERYRGSPTPAEELIQNLLEKYAWAHLTPEVVALHVEEFQQNFEDMVENAADFIKTHPDLFQELCAEIAGTARTTPAASAAV